MGLFAVREVIVVPFSFSDLSQTKDRPTICLAPVENQRVDDLRGTAPARAILTRFQLTQTDFESGGLKHHSFARPLKIFTVHERRIVRKAGKLKIGAFDRIIDALIGALRS